MRITRKQETDLAQAMDFLMPLHFFYERQGKIMPAIEFVPPAELPDNERELLAHDHDMTSALSEYHQSELGLNVIAREESQSYLMRLVVLDRLRVPRIPVEFGAIGIRLEFFQDSVRAFIATGEKPLGAILEDEHIHYHSHPKGFFKLRADRFISEWLAEGEQAMLWGRCNTLMDCQGEVFADIVEILPRALTPVPGSVHRNAQRCDSGTH